MRLLGGGGLDVGGGEVTDMGGGLREGGLDAGGGGLGDRGVGGGGLEAGGVRAGNILFLHIMTFMNTYISH